MKLLVTDALVGTSGTVAAAPAPTPLPLSRTQAAGLPQDPHRHPVRPQDRHRLGRPARRTGLRLRQDLPALPAALAPSRRLAQAACGAAGRTQRRRPDRLGAGADRRLLRQGPRRRRGYRPEPHGSRQIRQQAPRADRCPRHPAGRDGDGGQRQRSHPSLDSPDEHAAGRRQAGTQAARNPTACKATGATIPNRCGSCCVGWGSRRYWPRGTPEHGSGLGVYRWFVERTISWLHALRPAAAPLGSAHGNPRCVPPLGLCPDLFEVLGHIDLIFSERSKETGEEETDAEVDSEVGERLSPGILASYCFQSSRAPEGCFCVSTKDLKMDVDGISIPDSKMAREVTELVRETENSLLFNHSSRVYYFAAATGKRKGLNFDPELLYVSAMFHDMGLTPKYSSATDRFEVDGANAAREFLRQQRSPNRTSTPSGPRLGFTPRPHPQHMHPVVALLTNGVEMDVLGFAYRNFATPNAKRSWLLILAPSTLRKRLSRPFTMALSTSRIRRLEM